MSPVKESKNASPSLLLPAARNVKITGGTLAAILGHWANLERKPHNRKVGQRWKDPEAWTPCGPHSLGLPASLRASLTRKHSAL